MPPFRARFHQFAPHLSSTEEDPQELPQERVQSQGSSVGPVPNRSGSAVPVQEGNVGRDDLMAQLVNLVTELRREVSDLRRAQVQNAPEPVRCPSSPSQHESFQDYLKMLEHMRSIGTPKFRGTIDPVEADEWLTRLMRNMSASRCPSEYRKDIAVFQLDHDALNWWQTVERRYCETPITWLTFKKEFESKWFPQEARDKLEVKFLQLEQRDKSVREYEAEFTRLRKYSGDMVQGEFAMIRKFLRGLKPSLRTRLQVVDFHRLQDLVEKAVLIEEGLAEENASTLIQSKLPVLPKTVQGPRVFPAANQGNNQAGQSQVRVPFCRQCQTKHVGQCRPNQTHGKSVVYPSTVAAHITCFKCGEQGHYANTCPRKRNPPSANQPLLGNAPTRPALPAPPAKRQATARAYALDAPGPSKPPKDLIAG